MKSVEEKLKDLQRENEDLRRGYRSVSERLIGLSMLQHITQDLVLEVDVEQLLERILRSVIHALEATAGALLLLDSRGEELIFAVVQGGGGEALQGKRIARDKGVAGWSVCHNEPVIMTDVPSDQRFFEEVLLEVDFRVTSLICVPLVARGKAIGAIEVLNKVHGTQFDDHDLDMITTFAAQSAAAIENARLYQDLKRERDRIIAVEEDIRRRLARDLHDGPTQLVAAIIVNVELIRKLLEYEPEKVLSELENLVPLAQKALRQLRTLLFDLRPVILEAQGLVPALESYVLRQQEAGDLSVSRPSEQGLAYHLQVDGFSGRLVAQAERAIFGIVQEAVGNVKKHAEAQNVWISVICQRDQLQVQVRDDGQGFEVDRIEADYGQRGSLGLLNMQERAATIGGELSVHSQAGAGSSITLTTSLRPLLEKGFWNSPREP